MLPELNYIQILRKVQFPLFVLRSDEVSYQDGLVIISNQIVDDLNQPGKTLGMRRLQTPHPLYPIRECAFDFIGMIDAKKRHFIDNRGFYFSYNKTKFVKVISHKIIRKDAHGHYATVFCKGINFFFVLRSYPRGAEWAQVLYLDNLPWKLVSTSFEKVATYNRKI